MNFLIFEDTVIECISGILNYIKIMKPLWFLIDFHKLQELSENTNIKFVYKNHIIN